MDGQGTSLETGDTVGRFVIVGLVGRGGMGEVYAAYDPELDRKVAVKLLRARDSTSSDGRFRLLREAQAIAKLSHPNVVVVYDVGTRGDSVFLAMEFVDGSTVGYWMEAARRSVREVLGVFLAAGRGLCAAHEAGLVHRDFKPDNLMLTRDGQVRVMDFGLARSTLEQDDAPAPGAMEAPAAGEIPAPTAPPSADPDMVETMDLAGAQARAEKASGKYLLSKLTQTGARVGTPAYMAPEQFVGHTTDARTDQFSFCVALYEALYGQRPFAGKDVAQLMGNVFSGELAPPPADSRVPSWLRRILLRGLSLSPQERYPSMAALLAALQADPAVKRRKWLTAALVPVLALAGALAVSRLGRAQLQVCAAGGTRLSGLWEPGGVASARKQQIHQAFERTGKGYAAPAFAGASRLLDQYVARWVGMYTDACEATHLRGEQSAEVLDLRMSCLQERLTNVRALTDVYASADEGIVLNAVSAAGALPSLERCADVALLRAVVRPPEDPATRKRVGELRDRLARVIALRDSGQCALAEATGAPLLEAVRGTKYLPLLADTLNALGGLVNSCGDPSIAAVRLKEAFAAATASHHDQAAAEAALLLPGMAANRMGEIAMASDWLGISRGALSRLGGNARLESWFLVAEGNLKTSQHDYVTAVEDQRRALALKQKALGPDHPDTLISMWTLGATLSDAGQLDEALTADRLARASAVRVLGPAHPTVAAISFNECETLNRLGRHAEARLSCQRALDIFRQAGSDRSMLSYALTGIGVALLGEGKAAEAVAPLEEALATRVEKRLGPDLIGESRFALARALWSRPDGRSRALALARQARADYGTGASPKSIHEIDDWLARAKG